MLLQLAQFCASLRVVASHEWLQALISLKQSYLARGVVSADAVSTLPFGSKVQIKGSCTGA